jgi:hypothetical protein
MDVRSASLPGKSIAVSSATTLLGCAPAAVVTPDAVADT